MKYLRNSAEIRQELTSLFLGNAEKWAVVAFVGYNALNYLAECTTGLKVICWLKAGGTNPDGIRRLIDQGVTVFSCKRLHQKVYWRKGAGLIVGSANLSDNALGDEGLHEFGVFCDDKDFDIQGILNSLKYEPVTPRMLADLDIEHAAYHSRNRSDKRESLIPEEIPSFIDSLETKMPKEWKIITWMEKRKDYEKINAALEAQIGTRCSVNDNDVNSDSFAVGDFVLQIHTDDEDIIQIANAKWMLVDHIIHERDMNVIVQLRKLDESTPPPFALDASFRKKLKRIFNETEWDDVCDEHCVVRKPFLTAIRDLYSI